MNLFGSVRTRHCQDLTPTSEKGLALFLDATLGIRAHRWVRARTPTVHRCPTGEAVGGPQYDALRDKRAQPERQAPMSLKTDMVAEPCTVHSALKTGSSSELKKLSMRWTRSLRTVCGQSQATVAGNARRHAQATQVKSEELINKVQNEIAQLVEDEHPE